MTEQEESRFYTKAVNIGSKDFLNAIPQIHYLWQLYYSADAEVNTPHPANPKAKTFKDWLIHLTPEEYEVNAERYYFETGFKES